MTTTITASTPIHHPRRRTVLSAAVVAVLALGAGVAAGRLTSSDGATTHQARPAVAASTTSDVDALWDELSTMPVSERDNVVAGLSPSVRARLEATGLALATAAAH